MKKSKQSSFILLAFTMILLIGCRTAPIYNVNNAPVIQGNEKKLTIDQVEDSIKIAGYSLGWRMDTVKPGIILATLRINSHMAQVEIPFNETSYSIYYKDSIDLKYDGTNIHKNYDTWIRNLEQAINKQLGDRLKY